MRLPPALLALVAGALAAGCAATAPAPGPLDLGRPPDGLLARPDLQALVDLQVRRDADGLVAALASPDSLVRARAAFALGSVQAAEAVPALRPLLSDPVPAVRADAAFALGQAADSSAGVALVVSLRTEATPAVQAELLDALGKAGGRADLDALLRVTLPAPLEPWRALALARLAQRGVTSPEGYAWLAARLRADDPALRLRAAYGFARADAAGWRAQAPALRAAFDALPGDPARADLARALGGLDDAADLARFAAALAGDPLSHVRVNAARALGRQWAAAPARAALLAALDDPDPHVASTAATALAEGAASDAPDAAVTARALALVADGGRRWPVEAPLLPLLARAGRTDAVLAWAERQSDPFAQAAALQALGASADGAALTRLFTASQSEDVRVAAAALRALRERWETGDYPARRFFDAFMAAVERRDVATTSIAAPVLADSAFWGYGAAERLRAAYRQMTAPGDLEPMTAIVRAVGQIRDGGEVDFLLGIAIEGPQPLRAVARDALNERLVDGVDVEITGGGTTGTTGIDWAHLAQLGLHPRLVLDTDRGRIVIEMDTEAAPQTVQLLTRTAAGGRYDGVPFHRVVSNFVIQGGDYFRRDGYGGPETPIRSEFTRVRYAPLTAGMASSGKDTEGVQFFVTHSDQPHLDGRYTAFGRVVAGHEVVDAILVGDRIRRARVEPDRRSLRR